jgi:hypothetical protein
MPKQPSPTSGTTIPWLPNFVCCSLFVQIHRSFVISLKKIDKIQDNHVFIENYKISIGANYKEVLLKIIEGLG